MKPEIKQRIEQIRNGQVPEGYKKTKAGIVPEEWEETRLDKYLTVNKEKNVELKYSKEDVFSISGELGIVNQIELLGRSYAGVSVAPYGVVYPNDIVYTKSPLKTSPYGIIKANKTGKFGIVSTLYAVFHCNKNASSEFIQFYFESDHNLNNYLYPIVNIGAKHDMKISDENSLKGWVVFPPIAEQAKIAEILSTQDKLIELYQRKIDELQKLKKIYLSKMFPQKGKSIPEWRFPQFTDDWEQRKLGEMTSLITKGTTPLDKSNIGTVNFVKVESIDNSSGEITITQKISSEEHEGYLRRSQLKENDILFSIAGTLGRVTSVKSSILPANTNQALAIIRLKSGCLKYVKTYLKGKAVADFIKKNPTVGAQPNLSLEQVSNLGIALPSEIEQEQIGSFFEHLDNLIALHQRKLEENKKYKKALMQLLLTGIVRV